MKGETRTAGSLFAMSHKESVVSSLLSLYIQPFYCSHLSILMPESADSFEITTPVGETPSQLRRERTTDDPFRLDRSGSHFSPRRTEASSSRGNFGSYRPRQSISTASLRDRGRAFSRSASNSGWAGSLGRSLSQTRQPASTNWQSLQDLVDEPEEAEDDDITIHGCPTESRKSDLDSHSSYKSLRSFFPVPPASRSRALDIRRTDTEDEGVSASISGVFSTSPPSIDNSLSILGPPSTFLERTNEDSGERPATEHPEIGVKHPLLETRAPQRYESTPIIENGESSESKFPAQLPDQQRFESIGLLHLLLSPYSNAQCPTLSPPCSPSFQL